ncbi:hypothetical protein Btru_064395 [Bulinus truncatus]|nr:hypothetical protein Btru_064395 [Bulinus truncatus]
MIFGLAALIAGIVFKVNGWKDVSSIFELSDADNLSIKDAGQALSLGAIIFGAFIFVLAIMGLIGGCCKVKCLLVFYAIIVLILLLAEIAVVIFVGVTAEKIEDETKKELGKKLLNVSYTEEFDLNADKNKDIKTWSLVFKTLKCCGVNNTHDFDLIPFYSSHRPPNYSNKSVNYVPITCCKDYDFEKKENLTLESTWNKYKTCLDASDVSKYYTDGCVDKVVNVVTGNKWIFIGVGIAIFVIELLVIAMSFYLCSRHD